MKEGWGNCGQVASHFGALQPWRRVGRPPHSFNLRRSAETPLRWLRRAHAVEALRLIGRLRVGELELAGGNFRDAPERRPVGLRQGKIRDR